MTRLILAFIRHGDYHQLPNTPSAHQSGGLTQQGIEQTQQQADILRDYIQRKSWQMVPEIDCSQLLRAWQTAQLYQQSLQSLTQSPLTINSYDALAERSVGAVANLSVEQIESLIIDDPRYQNLPENWKSDSHFCLPFQGAESLMQAGERVATHIKQQMSAISRQSTTQLKIMIGHGAAFRHAAHLLGILEFEHIAQLSMYHARPIFFEYLSEGVWRHITGEWKQRKTVEAVD